MRNHPNGAANRPFPNARTTYCRPVRRKGSSQTSSRCASWSGSFSDTCHVRFLVPRWRGLTRGDGCSGHFSRVEYRRGPNGQPSAQPVVSLGNASPTPSPVGCRNTAMEATSSMVGKCLAMATALRLTSNGRRLSRASSIRNPPAHSSALVRSTGMVMAHLTEICVETACLRSMSRVANSRSAPSRPRVSRWPKSSSAIID